MNIIETTKKIINDYPNIKSFCNGISFDFTTNEVGSFGLFSSGDTLLKEDIFGQQQRKHSFVLYANNQSFNDFERLANGAFILELSYFLETVKNIPVTVNVNGEEKSGLLTKMTCANGMLYSVPTGDINDGVTYQLQIYSEYEIYN